MLFEHVELKDLPAVAAEIVEKMQEHSIVLFYGPMGAGKTTLIKEILKQCNVRDTVNSPTFSIVNEYHLSGDKAVYHFDFYRLKNIEEAYDIGYEDYFYGGNYCLIEWPDKIQELLPAKCLKVILNLQGENRSIEVVG